MKFFKPVTLIVACLLLVSMLSACGTPNDTPVDTVTDDTTAQTTTTTMSDAEKLASYRVSALEETEYYEAVRTIIDNLQVDKTALPYTMLLDPYRGGNTGPYADHSALYAATVIASQTAANPYTLFNAVCDELLPTSNTKRDGAELCISEARYVGTGDCSIGAVTSTVAERDYPYSEEGCRELLSDIAEQARLDGEYITVAQIVKANLADNAAFHYSEKDNCRYAYFIAYNDGLSYVLNVYCKSSDGKVIDDLSFEYIASRYIRGGAAGSSLSLRHTSNLFAAEEIAWVAACERVLTNTTSFDHLQNGNLVPHNVNDVTYTLPASYTIGDAQTTVQSAYASREDGYSEHYSMLSMRFTK